MKIKVMIYLQVNIFGLNKMNYKFLWVLTVSHETRYLNIEKNSPAVPELGSWCHLGPRTLNNVFLGP
jgi:hypothetical protein